MIRSRATRGLWKCFYGLPDHIQEEARQAYRHFRANPAHPGLQFKKLHRDDKIYSARITLEYRALGVMRLDHIVWYWIGSHDDYDRLV